MKKALLVLSLIPILNYASENSLSKEEVDILKKNNVTEQVLHQHRALLVNNETRFSFLGNVDTTQIAIPEHSSVVKLFEKETKLKRLEGACCLFNGGRITSGSPIVCDNNSDQSVLNKRLMILSITQRAGRSLIEDIRFDVVLKGWNSEKK